MCSQTFLTASEREASVAPRNFPSCGDTETTFNKPTFGRASLAGEAETEAFFDEEEVDLTAAIRALHRPPSPALDAISYVCPSFFLRSLS